MGASRCLASRLAQFVPGSGLGSLADKAVSRSTEAVDVASTACYTASLSERLLQPHSACKCALQSQVKLRSQATKWCAERCANRQADDSGGWQALHDSLAAREAGRTGQVSGPGLHTTARFASRIRCSVHRCAGQGGMVVAVIALSCRHPRWQRSRCQKQDRPQRPAATSSRRPRQ